jgi:hypothetical protein
VANDDATTNHQRNGTCGRQLETRASGGSAETKGSDDKNGWQTTTQQPTIDGNGTGGWRLATRASGGSAAMRELNIKHLWVMTKVDGGLQCKYQPTTGAAKR